MIENYLSYGYGDIIISLLLLLFFIGTRVLFYRKFFLIRKLSIDTPDIKNKTISNIIYYIDLFFLGFVTYIFIGKILSISLDLMNINYTSFNNYFFDSVNGWDPYFKAIVLHYVSGTGASIIFEM